jgi:hypothetical protein
MQARAVRRDNAGRLLAAMLELMQPEVGELGSFRVGVDSDHSTFVLKLVATFIHSLCSKPLKRFSPRCPIVLLLQAARRPTGLAA